MKATRKPVKVVYVIAQVAKAVGFEWLVERLDLSRIDISFVLMNDGPSELSEYLKQRGIPVTEIQFRGKFSLPLAFLRLVQYLTAIKPDVVHTHLVFADLAGLSAAKLVRIPKRIYTRHSSNFNRKYHDKQYLERTANFLATDIVAISDNVRNILTNEEHVPAGRISLIHHGFDFDRFERVPQKEIEALRSKYDPNGCSPVIGVIARYMEWKGILYSIDAFQALRQSYPNALLILANAGGGDAAEHISKRLSQLPPGSYREIRFEPNLFALYRLFDVYVHVPVDPEIEAFGQTYVEALAAGIPSVFTLSGVAREFIVNEQNALVVDFRDSSQILMAIKRLLTEPDLSRTLSERGQADVKARFGIEKQVALLEALYAK